MTDALTDGRLILDRTLTVRDAPAIRAMLQDMLGRHQAVSIDCAAAPEIDLSFVQLLIAARASATRANRSVTLASAPAGALLHTLTRGGFRVVREQSPDGAAFWFAGALA